MVLCRHKGVLQVWVLEAKDLHKQDIGGKADPFVQLQTRVQDLEKTVGLIHSHTYAIKQPNLTAL